MADVKNGKVTIENEKRVNEIAELLEAIPEHEQEKLLYIIKGVALASAYQNNTVSHAAVV